MNEGDYFYPILKILDEKYTFIFNNLDKLNIYYWKLENY